MQSLFHSNAKFRKRRKHKENINASRLSARIHLPRLPVLPEFLEFDVRIAWVCFSVRPWHFAVCRRGHLQHSGALHWPASCESFATFASTV